MVYCGKPSKGCHQCRRRKIKCDQGEPSCGQCHRANYICPGYRNQLDLLFRDETQKVATKAGAVSRQTNPTRLPASSVQTVATPNDESATRRNARHKQISFKSMRRYQGVHGSGPLSSRALPVELTHRAICFFVSNYSPLFRLLGPGCVPPVALMDALFDDETLSVCMTAVITCRGATSLQTWRNHMQGATALLNLRSQMNSFKLDRFRTVVQIRGQIISGCLVAQSYAPPLIDRHISLDRSEMSDAELALEDVTVLLIELTNLRASVKEGVISSPYEILCMALDLRERFLAFERLAEDKYPFRRIMNWDGKSRFLPRESVYEDYFDVYPSIYAASIWNGYRAGRITLSGTIFNQFSELQTSCITGSTLSDEICIKVDEENAQIEKLAQDICSSAPFALEMIRWDAEAVSVNPAGPCGLGGFLLLWPLCLAAEVGKTMPKLQTWIVREFELIGHLLGISQALWMSNLIKKKYSIGEWLVCDGLSEWDFWIDHRLDA
ncbi:predicted protein [Uncinocarpus reesii 1704]|uniref:Zn(2)-C6 fungal-type domain-containing protein n=1 Tax=Uncinocarpus reesii (strain UAMH 1704) TaxID=336963 RepID=C4JI94_UNCRE|nr:uncharacterized protein UREG_02840 [Uncinocarpus reesii 1704]EEP77991.1 predicted protein [Uncinocarpus reesii 1704]